MDTLMIWSRYNLLFGREGVYVLYNSLSNAVVEISHEIYKSLFKLLPGDSCDWLEDDVREVLKKTKSIVESDEVELLKIKHKTYQNRHSQKILNLTINPTLACNFSCTYCFEKEHANIYMSDKIEDDIISYIKNYKEIQGLRVTWFGGEPLLNFKGLKSLSTKMLALGYNYSAGIITNGYLLTPDVVSEFPQLNIRTIQVTLDGVRTGHNARRSLKNGAPTFDVIVRNIRYIAENIPSITINIRVNIDKTNKDAFIELFEEYNGKYKNLNIYPAFVKDENGCDTCTSSLNISERFTFNKDLYNKTGINFNRFINLNGRTECAVRCNTSIVIGPEGELYKCWDDVGDKDMVYGYIANGGYVTNESLLYNYLIGADQFNDSKCIECLMLPACAGGCPKKRIQDTQRKKKMSCPYDVNKITDYIWAHYCVKTNRKINV